MEINTNTINTVIKAIEIAQAALNITTNQNVIIGHVNKSLFSALNQADILQLSEEFVRVKKEFTQLKTYKTLEE